MSTNPRPRKIVADGFTMLLSGALTGPGPLEITARSCVICGPDKDCDCHTVAFGSDEYYARIDRAHDERDRGQ